MSSPNRELKKCLTCDRFQYCSWSKNQAYNGCRRFLPKIDRWSDLFGDDGEEHHPDQENATEGDLFNV